MCPLSDETWFCPIVGEAIPRANKKLENCPLIEIDENDPVLLEFLNEFGKWRAYKEVMNYIKSIYKEGEANDKRYNKNPSEVG